MHTRIQIQYETCFKFFTEFSYDRKNVIDIPTLNMTNLSKSCLYTS